MGDVLAGKRFTSNNDLGRYHPLTGYELTNGNKATESTPYVSINAVAHYMKRHPEGIHLNFDLGKTHTCYEFSYSHFLYENIGAVALIFVYGSEDNQNWEFAGLGSLHPNKSNSRADYQVKLKPFSARYVKFIIKHSGLVFAMDQITLEGVEGGVLKSNDDKVNVKTPQDHFDNNIQNELNKLTSNLIADEILRKYSELSNKNSKDEQSLNRLKNSYESAIKTKLKKSVISSPKILSMLSILANAYSDNYQSGYYVTVENSKFEAKEVFSRPSTPNETTILKPIKKHINQIGSTDFVIYNNDPLLKKLSLTYDLRDSNNNDVTGDADITLHESHPTIQPDLNLTNELLREITGDQFITIYPSERKEVWLRLNTKNLSTGNYALSITIDNSIILTCQVEVGNKIVSDDYDSVSWFQPVTLDNYNEKVFKEFVRSKSTTAILNYNLMPKMAVDSSKNVMRPVSLDSNSVQEFENHLTTMYHGEQAKRIYLSFAYAFAELKRTMTNKTNHVNSSSLGDYGSNQYGDIFKEYAQALIDYLKTQNFLEKNIVFYFWDEIGLSGDESVNVFSYMAGLVKSLNTQAKCETTLTEPETYYSNFPDLETNLDRAVIVDYRYTNSFKTWADNNNIELASYLPGHHRGVEAYTYYLQHIHALVNGLLGSGIWIYNEAGSFLSCYDYNYYTIPSQGIVYNDDGECYLNKQYEGWREGVELARCVTDLNSSSFITNHLDPLIDNSNYRSQKFANLDLEPIATNLNDEIFTALQDA